MKTKFLKTDLKIREISRKKVFDEKNLYEQKILENIKSAQHVFQKSPNDAWKRSRASTRFLAPSNQAILQNQRFQ